MKKSKAVLRLSGPVGEHDRKIGQINDAVHIDIRDRIASLTRPVMELKGFQRITLHPGETRMVTFPISPEDLSFLDIDMQRVVEPGIFDVMVGGSSDQTESVDLEVIPIG